MGYLPDFRCCVTEIRGGHPSQQTLKLCHSSAKHSGYHHIHQAQGHLARLPKALGGLLSLRFSNSRFRLRDL